jgi:hypothetical protein
MSELEFPKVNLSECDRVCMTKFKLEEEKIKNYSLKQNLEKYKQDMRFLLKRLSFIFAINLYIDRIRDLPLVESVYVIEKEEMIDIWTFIEEGNLNVEEKIAEAQCELMRVHRELDFDFMVIPRSGREQERLLPSESKQIYPEDELR